MSRDLIIRYRSGPRAAEENSRLVEAVFASLAQIKASGFVYAT